MDFDTAIAAPAFRDLADLIAEQTKALVAWIGAGLSVPANLPSWPTLRRLLHEATTAKINTFSEPDRTRKRATLGKVVEIKDPWTAFERLSSLLGRESFAAEIRRHLSIAGKVIPESYKLLLRLPLSGILSLNIDDFCKDAVRRKPEKWLTFAGREAPRMTHLLKQPQPFIASLHGAYDDESSWVFKKADIRTLLADEGYKTFIRSLLATKTVLFMGISADDIASGGFLEGLEALGVRTGPHYWLTDRSDARTDSWAERVGIRIIRYNKANNHKMFLDMLNYLAEHKSLDSGLVPLVVSTASASPLPLPDVLAAKSPNTIRKLINDHLGTITDRDKIAKFLREYRRAIYQAWFVDIQAPDNEFFDLKIEPSSSGQELGVGAFGRVFLARRPDNELVAIKILHQDVSNKEDMLDSFRRGVRSLKFLTNDNIPGVVKCYAAYEIPACVVMEYIPGTTLLEAVQIKLCEDWHIRLEILQSISSIIRSAHESSQRVLHRDIRPHNIILRNFFAVDDDIDVVVLDFDLSWHRDSLERSVYPHIEGALGYGAPEQFDRGIAGRTRTSLVDCFGLGMTMFFVATGRHPDPREQDRKDWSKTLRKEVASQTSREWTCLAPRFARLIERSTYSDQLKRCDFATMVAELTRLSAAIKRSLVSASVVAEEILCRLCGYDGYEWSTDSESGITHLSGGELRISADEAHKSLSILMTWTDSGDRDRRSLPKALENVRDFASRRISQVSSEFNITLGTNNIRIEITLDAERIINKIDQCASVLDEIRGKFSF